LLDGRVCLDRAERLTERLVSCELRKMRVTVNWQVRKVVRVNPPLFVDKVLVARCERVVATAVLSHGLELVKRNAPAKASNKQVEKCRVTFS
jgi:hypothetical protein